MKYYQPSPSFSVLWGLLGLWILLGGLFFSLSLGGSPFWSIFFAAAILMVLYPLISGKGNRKKEYTAAELIQRGILMMLILCISGIMAYFLDSIRPYVIFHMIGMVVLLGLVGLQLHKAEKEEGHASGIEQ